MFLILKFTVVGFLVSIPLYSTNIHILELQKPFAPLMKQPEFETLFFIASMNECTMNNL